MKTPSQIVLSPTREQLEGFLDMAPMLATVLPPAAADGLDKLVGAVRARLVEGTVVAILIDGTPVVRLTVA